MPGPITPYEAQLRFLDEVCFALSNDIHHCVNLKARQLGVSTITWALDLFWLFMHPGLQGALIFDTRDNLDIARQTITEMLDSMPPGFRVPVARHNKNYLLLANGPNKTAGSRLQYMVAGKKKGNSGLGRSRALNFVHASECSSYGDQKALDALVRSLAEENPDRLYIFESTALGFNVFYDMCKDAKEDPSKHYFFIGWWAKDIYRVKRGTKDFDRWWGASPNKTDEEIKKCNEVLDSYGHAIDEEQIAWYRKQSFNKSAATLSEELPWTESEAFVATGSAFFSLQRVTEDIKFLIDNKEKVKFSAYRYNFGSVFTDTKVTPCDSAAEADLRVWEEPRKGARYVIGGDPAYGRSATADRQAISVWRCFADKLIQVAEFATPHPEAIQFAWALAHLAGCYRDCVVNIEINGPGAVVMEEIRHLKQQIAYGRLRGAADDLQITNALDNARWFLFHRPDSPSGGYMFNTRTTDTVKAEVYGSFRDHYNTEALLVRSLPLLDEMRTLVQNEHKIEASGRNKDDRVFAGGLANQAWVKWVRQSMIIAQRTHSREMAKQRQEEGPQSNLVVNHIVTNYFAEKQQEKAEAYRRLMVEGF